MEERPTDTDKPTTDQEAPAPGQQPLPLDPAEQPRSDDPVEGDSEDSFPASDPPSFTRSTSD
jgi:hypothetical protein